ncbi:MAG TPA: DNA translocase FtsK [Anaerolineae bacterium]|nr:DNA translocase FtsK [Anaerolineae bacterium]
MAEQWQLPPIDQVLDEPPPETGQANLLRQKRLIEATLSELGFEAKVQQVQPGPRFTRFGLSPGAEGQLSKVKNLDKDLALALDGATVQIDLPTPDFPMLGVLVLPAHAPEPTVKLRQILETKLYKQAEGTLKVGLGLNLVGQPVIIDLAELPHLLIGGTTGSGKSDCLHNIIANLLCNYAPNQVQLLMIDPLAIELRDYSGLPHLFAPVVTRSAQALDTLNTIDKVIDRRYRAFADNQARDIAGYNQKLKQARRPPIPYIIIAIDNVFDLMMTAAREVEQVITRMAQRAWGAGVHLIFATPRADTEALSGTIKANFPARIALRVIGAAESRLILDAAGAEVLLGQGDLLYRAPNTTELTRLQGVHISEDERRRLVQFWRS